MGDPDHVVIDISKHTGKNGQILYFKAPKQAAEVSTAMRDAGYVGMLRDPSDPEVLLCGRDNLSANKVYQFWPPNASGRGGAGSSRQGGGRQSQAANGSVDVNGLEIIDSILTSSGAMEDTAPVTSIFVKGLTENVTKENLHDAFAQFGEIRNGLSGISLKPARDNRDPIAFVTFLSAESVPGAVAGPVYLDDQQVTVAERRPRTGRFRGPGGGRGGGRRNQGQRRNRRPNQGGEADGQLQGSGQGFDGPAEL